MASKQETKKKYVHYVPPAKKVPEWYKKFNFVLVETMDDLREIFRPYEGQKFYMSFDTETTGLNFEEIDIVGFSFCLDGKTAYYVAVNHFECECNLGEEAIDFIYAKMCEAAKVFMFNCRYDMRVMQYVGYKARKEELDKIRWKYAKYDMSKVDYYDVAVACWIADTNNKACGLKWASLHYLGFDQMHFDEVVEQAGNFYYLNPQKTEEVVFYAAADALCTMLLVPATMKFFKEGKQAAQIDNQVLYPLMNYEQEKLYLDGELIQRTYQEAQAECDRLEREVYDAFGFQINLNSPMQVAQAFQRLGIDTGEKTETGNMATGMTVLEKLPAEVKAKFPALDSFIKFKETFKLCSTYFSVLSKLFEQRDFIRGAYKTTEVPTGRLAAGKDGKNSYFAPLNLQALSKPHVMMFDVFDLGDRTRFSREENIILGYKFVISQNDADGKHIVPDDPAYIGQAEGMNPRFNVRACLVPATLNRNDPNYAPDEWIYCSCDYAAEELRLAANLSREPVWVQSFIEGKDIHEQTARQLFGDENYNRDARKKAKACSFGILYGMGASSLVDNPLFNFNSLAEAEEFYEQFKAALPVLFQWEEKVHQIARKRGTVYTFFGRPRRLKGYYDANNIGFANRTATNTQVQGTAGDILKGVMCKLWRNLLDNPEYRDDVRFMITIHDELGFAIRARRATEIAKLIVETMHVHIPAWPVDLICEPSFGWSVGGVFDFEVDQETGEYKPAVK